jgi:hypothetical protein
MMAGDTDADSSAKGLAVNIARRFLDALILSPRYPSEQRPVNNSNNNNPIAARDLGHSFIQANVSFEYFSYRAISVPQHTSHLVATWRSHVLEKPLTYSQYWKAARIF